MYSPSMMSSSSSQKYLRLSYINFQFPSGCDKCYLDILDFQQLSEDSHYLFIYHSSNQAMLMYMSSIILKTTVNAVEFILI